MEQIKVVGILGSPRKGGNSDILLDICLKLAEEGGANVKKFVLNSMKFRPCQECAVITKDGKCKIQDEMQDIFPVIEQADVVVVASPIFFGSVSAQTKMMIDRFQCQWLGINFFKSYKNLKRKKGVFLSVQGANRQDFFDNAKAIIKNFFVTIGASYKHELLCPLVDDKGDIHKYPECLNRAEEIGRLLLQSNKKK
jgi:multimeric flavodoxin WrbA